MYKDKSKWATVEVSKKSREIATLLGVEESKILRIGNDTSDEAEMSHMTQNFIDSAVVWHEPGEYTDFLVCVKAGVKFVKEENSSDLEAYYIVNDGGEPATFRLPGTTLLTEKDVDHMKWIYGRLLLHGEKPNVDYMVRFREIFGIPDRGILTHEELLDMEPKTIIAQGIIENSPSGLYMTSEPEAIGKKLMWVARRGGGHDWTIYTHWEERGMDYVLKNGDKVTGKDNIQKLVPCTPEAMSMYRF
jgi:hypothetical protein